ncbi:MAG: hypothetical protein R2734_16870 [Nocardioides sp.]
MRSASALGAAALAAGPELPLPATAATGEPCADPALQEAFAAWRELCYGATPAGRSR